jgi:hypothetical protein
MPYNLNTSDLIRQLKTIREKQNLTLQDIYEMLEQANSHISMCTIQKVFADGSEGQRFRYRDTIQPIAKILLGENGEECSDGEIDALRASIKIKNELIGRQEREIASIKSEYNRKTEFLLKQIALKDERIDRLMARVDVLLAQTQKLLDRCDNCAAKSKN